ncbi:hypothetical protein [Pseudomonas sp. NFACC45]|uniref:hypothetical protein n=1 Tax=Pseudomonas sp. NFACC45 TaxID=1566201 RepID=UPI0015A52D16|nr:hypothetical protein [Pseudomonas sp. NFACC45]
MIQHDQLNGTKAYYRVLETAIRSNRLPEQPACIIEFIAPMTHLQTAKALQSPSVALIVGQLDAATRYTTSLWAVPLTPDQNKSTTSQLGTSTLNPDPRVREIYLNTIGGLLTVMLGQSPSGVRYSTFNTLMSVISALIAFHGDRPGISAPALRKTFADVRRHFCK